MHIIFSPRPVVSGTGVDTVYHPPHMPPPLPVIADDELSLLALHSPQVGKSSCLQQNEEGSG